MDDDIAKQLKERRAREQARHDKQMSETMDIDNNQLGQQQEQEQEQEQHQHDNIHIPSSSSSSSQVHALQESLKKRQQTIEEIGQQLQELQRRYQNERLGYQREQNALNRLTGNNTNIDNNHDDVLMREPMADEHAKDERKTEDQTRQIMTDEELAKHLAAQFEREAKEEQEEEEEQERLYRQRQPQQQQYQPQQQQQQQQYQQRPDHSERSNAPTVRSYTFGDPRSGGGFVQFSTSSSSSSDDPMSRGFGPGGVMDFGLDPFFSNNPFDLFSRRRNRNFDDPFARMRIHPTTIFPGLMFGGALVDDNTDYDTLMRLFPPAPRGANQGDIQQLPEDVYRPKTKEKETLPNLSEARKKSKEEDEFHRCSICLESFKEGDSIRRLPCLHIFHRDEIDNWLSRNHLCPICRTPIEQNDPQPSPSNH